MAQARKSGTGLDTPPFQLLVGTLSHIKVDSANASADLSVLANVGDAGERVVSTIALTRTPVIVDNDTADANVMYVAVEGEVTDTDAANIQASVRALGGALAAATVEKGEYTVTV